MAKKKEKKEKKQKCRVCGCTDDDCSQCVAATGEACFWVEDDLCSRCEAEGCKWTYNDENYENYETSCGCNFSLVEGGSDSSVAEYNGFVFCPGCGKKIIEG